MGGALDAVNDAFHAMYDASRASAEHDAPVLVVLGDALTLCRGRGRQVFAVTPRAFHRIKSAAHAPVAIFAALTDAAGSPLAASLRRGLTRLRVSTNASLADVDGDDAIAADVRAVLARSVAFLDVVLGRRVTSRRALGTFARGVGRLLTRLTRHATGTQLASLDAAVNTALGGLTRAQRRALQVVVTGDHQARSRSLAMQYFQKRFGERAGAELRVAYGESIASVDEALALVGTRRLDRAVAAAFFGDAKRLQQDVLGRAAAQALARSRPGRI